MIGDTFNYHSVKYVVDSIEPIDTTLTSVIKALQDSGKETNLYFASNLLTSGKKSKRGGMFYRFVKTGNYIKVL